MKTKPKTAHSGRSYQPHHPAGESVASATAQDSPAGSPLYGRELVEPGPVRPIRITLKIFFEMLRTWDTFSVTKTKIGNYKIKVLVNNMDDIRSMSSICYATDIIYATYSDSVATIVISKDKCDAETTALFERAVNGDWEESDAD